MFFKVNDMVCRKKLQLKSVKLSFLFVKILSLVSSDCTFSLSGLLNGRYTLRFFNFVVGCTKGGGRTNRVLYL